MIGDLRTNSEKHSTRFDNKLKPCTVCSQEWLRVCGESAVMDTFVSWQATPALTNALWYTN